MAQIKTKIDGQMSKRMYEMESSIADCLEQIALAKLASTVKINTFRLARHQLQVNFI